MGGFGHGDEPEEEGADEEHDGGEEDGDPDQASAREALLLLSLNAFLLFRDSPRRPRPVSFLGVGARDVAGLGQNAAGPGLRSVGPEREGVGGCLLHVPRVLVVHGAGGRALPRRGPREALRQRVHLVHGVA